FWSFLIELPSVVIAAVAGMAAVATMVMLPQPSEAATLLPYWRILLFTPSHHDVLQTVYAWVPWFVPSGLGIILGRIVYRKPARTALIAFGAGAALRAAHVALQTTPSHQFLKSPPTPSFLSVTLGLDLVLLGILALVPDNPATAFLEVFGRS